MLTRPLVEAVEVVVHKPQAPVGHPFTDVQVRLRRERETPVVIALGSNLGESVDTLHDAAVALFGLIDIEAVSPVFETDPVGGPDQPAYLNAVVVGTTSLAPRALLRFLHDIEREHGRTREVRWGPRTLDLDLIQYGDPVFNTDVQMDDPALTLPHPRAHERAFVLLPWLQADPEAALRVEGEVRRVAELARRAWTRPACVPGLRATCWTTVVNQGRGLRLGHLVGVTLVLGGLSWMGWRLYLNSGSLLPPASWISAVLLAVMAALVFAAGLPVRRFLRGQATKPLSPIRAARTLVLAQAAALTGAGVLGCYAAQLALALAGHRPAGLPQPDVAAPRPVSRRGPAGGRRHGDPADVPHRRRRARRGGLSPTCRRRRRRRTSSRGSRPCRR